MAREAYRSLYGDLTKLKDTSLLNLTGVGDDPELWQLLLSMSEWVDTFCNRHFYTITKTMLYDGTGERELLIPDLAVITSLKTDDNDDKVFETTWATNDFWLEPYNAQPTQPWGQPYTLISVRTAGTKKEFEMGEQNTEIVGRWGYREYKELSTSKINQVGGISATATSVTVTSGADFAIGQTIMVETEQILITNISTNTLTIQRALNGTTAAIHADALDVFILRWPLAVERATLMTAARVWSRSPEFEPFYVAEDVDTDIQLLLDPYRRIAVGI